MSKSTNDRGYASINISSWNAKTCCLEDQSEQPTSTFHTSSPRNRGIYHILMYNSWLIVSFPLSVEQWICACDIWSKTKPSSLKTRCILEGWECVATAMNVLPLWEWKPFYFAAKFWNNVCFSPAHSSTVVIDIKRCSMVRKLPNALQKLKDSQLFTHQSRTRITIKLRFSCFYFPFILQQDSGQLSSKQHC